MGNGLRRTSGKYPPEESPDRTAVRSASLTAAKAGFARYMGVLDSHALTSALQGGSLDSEGTEAACFSKLCGLLTTSKKKIDPHICSLKMLKTCLALAEEQTSSAFSLRWTKAGMMQNGRFSIQPDMSRKIGSAYSLWDILEDEVPAKYFLSMEQMQRILFFK